MSAKAVREYDGKLLLAHWLLRTPIPATSISATGSKFIQPSTRLAHVGIDTAVLNTDKAVFAQHVRNLLDNLEQIHPWLLTTKLVAKPDQLIKRRGKSGLLLLNADWTQVRAWVTEHAGKEVIVDNVAGVLKTFLIEPFIPHPGDTEYYICINSDRNGDNILFTHEGGIEVGDVDAKALKLQVKVNDTFPTPTTIQSLLLVNVPVPKHDVLIDFITRLYSVYVDLHFTYLEINPLVVLDPTPEHPAQVYYLDLAAKVDQTAEFEAGPKWAFARAPQNIGLTIAANQSVDAGPPLDFPAPFGRELTKEEAYVQELDSKTGASLKLTILNKDGRIWTMVAGGGASVVYSDAIAALGQANELANYGEYSGAPTETQTYEYAKTILDLMTRNSTPHPLGKVLIIGGGIANFTNVASTFKGIVRALTEFKQPLIAHKVRIFVRRGGPNYQEGLRSMRQLGETLGVEIQVFGPETHITEIVPLALTGKTSGLDRSGTSTPLTSGNLLQDQLLGSNTPLNADSRAASPPPLEDRMTYFQDQGAESAETSHDENTPFTAHTRSFIYGMQPRAVQGMLDFDFICKREVPSVAAMVYPFGGAHVQKFYWGTKETLLPVFTSLDEAVIKFPEVDTVVNFASCRSVYDSTREIFKYSKQIRIISIIAEGVPERRARQILWEAKERNVLVIGPATVGGIKPGCFKIGNTGGMMDNIVSSKLYRPGSVAYVSKSGGMSNELNNIISRTTDGVYEGVAIGGDRYPGSTFIDHLLRYEKDPGCKMLVLLGEVGGVEEYKVCEAVKNGIIRKPVIAWCIGTCAKMFATEVQFGHAGALAQSDLETADAKNRALRAAGVIVPETFEKLPLILSQTFQTLVKKGVITVRSEPETPKIPIDYSWAQELGLVRKPASFVSTICDDRGQELLYAGMRISDVFKDNIGIGGVLSLLWFKRRLPDYACKFIEMVLMLTADHGPAVSGAHNTIVTARAGKDLVSSLCAGLLTIGDRFGGALDGAAEQFSSAYDKSLSPREFVNSMRKQNKLILGIGHKIKSRTNPDLRVEIIKNYAKANFPSTPVLDYALAVEMITTSKKDNLILNVDGAIGVLFVDLLRHSGAFTREEAEEYIKIGTLNGLFVLGRSIGFIGHFLDQKRLKQGLYRHPWDDISYLTPGHELGRTVASLDSINKKAA
ncbi:citrate synthase [Lobosporangium transversale]|uniref:ATP citrate synthase n=1 Tax=Lobosporangium transversale TaxID=64571 RepID=A0A1Y2GME6_9FUNG|nr:citrate synthase-like protein [Lobosporangium transversale]KAF9916381.1 citrate synthase [Lobosporangium transversale]ORZ13888.1 citrate synthase-like protein [Lobosporangium transversale]|eukprot:XP_021880672.1 citrate synthase-like protein [Lobosporangium transversale]